MRIRIHFSDGHIEEFDTSSLVASSPFGRSCVISDFELSIRDDGLWVEASWYDMAGGEPGSMLAQRREGCSLHLLNAEELGRTIAILNADTLLYRRVGPDFVDVVRYEQAMATFFEPDELPRSSMAARAERLLGILRMHFSGKEESELLAMMGMSKVSFQFMSGAGDTFDSGKVYFEEGS